MDQAWRVGEEQEGTGMTGTTLPLDRAALSVALGRENVVHLALTDQAAAERIGAPLRRLQRFLGRAELTGELSRLPAADRKVRPQSTTD